MFLKRKDEQKQLKKYKATYKSLYSGNVKEFAIAEPTNALAYFLQKGEGISEMYILISVTPLDVAE